MQFNSAPPTTMHIDINSCFATIEQQANPLLRGKPVAVAAYVKDYGCILAASYEAKRLGVKTGMRVKEGRMLAPRLIVLPPDPPKYRAVNKQLFALLSFYTPHISVESIDEMVMKLSQPEAGRPLAENIAKDIKQRIKKEIGEWITVSIGIAPNRYLAKVASGLEKPDGLVAITQENVIETFGNMQLTDFCGIKEGNAGRLRAAGIRTPLEFFRASTADLKRAFRSIVGYQWWLRLHGYEDGVMYKDFEKDREEEQKSFGQSYALGRPYLASDPRLWQILTQLVMKMGRRLRHDGFVAYGAGISLLFGGYTHWHTQEKHAAPLCTDRDFFLVFRQMLEAAPMKEIKLLAIYCYALARDLQGSLLLEDAKNREVSRALDKIQDRFGDFIIHPARMLAMEQKVLDRIAFGKV